jgi:hypothetical protein
MLIPRLKQILDRENLDSHRLETKAIASELGVDSLDLAAALLFLNHRDNGAILLRPLQKSPVPAVTQDNSYANVKLIRYRLDVGSQHQVTEDSIKKLLVSESGVDKNNILNVTIQASYTLVDLPDNMPQDIFLHLKTVELHQQKLDIKRVKGGDKKKRGKNRARRRKQRNINKLAFEIANLTNEG